MFCFLRNRVFDIFKSAIIFFEHAEQSYEFQIQMVHKCMVYQSMQMHFIPQTSVASGAALSFAFICAQELASFSSRRLPWHPVAFCRLPLPPVASRCLQLPSVVSRGISMCLLAFRLAPPLLFFCCPSIFLALKCHSSILFGVTRRHRLL